MGARIAVILIAYHADPWILPCLESLLPANTRPDVIVVDNGGNTKLREVMEKHPEVRVLATAKSLGFAEANNFALNHLDAACEVVCFLNQDTLSDGGWLDECVRVLATSPNLAAVIPVTHTYDWSGFDAAFLDSARAAGDLLERIRGSNPVEPVYEVPVLPAAALVVKMSVLKQTGGFDPIFGSYYEDYDLCRRIREAGYTLGIATAAKVAHFSGSATVTADAKWQRGRRLVRNRLIYETRLASNHRLRHLLGYAVIRFPRDLLRSIFRRSSHPPLQYLAGHWDAVRLLPRLASEERDRSAWQRNCAVGLQQVKLL